MLCKFDFEWFYTHVVPKLLYKMVKVSLLLPLSLQLPTLPSPPTHIHTGDLELVRPPRVFHSYTVESKFVRSSPEIFVLFQM